MRIVSIALVTVGLLIAALLARLSLGTDRDALRRIVQDECMPHWRALHDPAPCVSIEPMVSGGSGYAVLPDRKGGAHFLLIPTATVSGIESPVLEQPATPNYFLAAWRARARLEERVGHPLARSAVGLAINPQRARSQDQLHIHIECLRSEVARALALAAEGLGPRWSPLEIDAARFEARRLDGEDPEGPSPFDLLAANPPEPGHPLGDFTLVLAGMQFSSGPGFVLLAGTQRAGELLLDSSCAVARG